MRNLQSISDTGVENSLVGGRYKISVERKDSEPKKIPKKQDLFLFYIKEIMRISRNLFL